MKIGRFASAGREFPAGQVLQVELGRLPLPWMAYGKWVAVAVMFGLIAGPLAPFPARQSAVARPGVAEKADRPK